MMRIAVRPGFWSSVLCVLANPFCHPRTAPRTFGLTKPIVNTFKTSNVQEHTAVGTGNSAYPHSGLASAGVFSRTRNPNPRP